MTVRRIMGYETEYAIVADVLEEHEVTADHARQYTADANNSSFGISSDEHSDAATAINHRADNTVTKPFSSKFSEQSHANNYAYQAWSSKIVDMLRDSTQINAYWDYSDENPRVDARGTILPIAATPEDLLTNRPILQRFNVPTLQGGRVYVDHAHPELATPEVMTPFDIPQFVKAGDRILRSIMFDTFQTDTPIHLYRNNVDGKGASWGTHENFTVARTVPFQAIIDLLTPHFVTRQIYTGSGRVGIGEHSEIAGYQLTQRADYFHMNVGLQTTFQRPIINTRDEAHNIELYRRLHCITGDANCMDIPQILAMGTTSMLLWSLEQVYGHPSSSEHPTDTMEDFRTISNRDTVMSADFLADAYHELIETITLADSVESLHTVSHDLTLRQYLPTMAGTSLTAWNIQIQMYQFVVACLAHAYGTDSSGNIMYPDDDTQRIMTMWQQALHDCAVIAHSDDNARLQLHEEASRIEWLLKWQVFETFRSKHQTTWDNATLQAYDIAWGDLDERRSIVGKLRRRIAHYASEEDIQHSMVHAPSNTRAWLRSWLLCHVKSHVVAIGWTCIVLRNSHGECVRIHITNPILHTSDLNGQLVECHDSIDAIIEVLTTYAREHYCK